MRFHTLAALSRLAVAVIAATAAAAPATSRAQQQQPGAHREAARTAANVRAKPDAVLMRSALAAAPAHIAKNASVVVPNADGTTRELRKGTNGFVCMPDAPDSPGPDPMCLDEQAQLWAQSWMAKEPKPRNTAPGIIYMLQGGSDISATDPFATTTDHYVPSPPHWMVIWPVDAQASGLSTKPKKTGTWVMWAGTPYAHLMINQVP